MTIGPEPMIRIDLMSVRFGIIIYLSFLLAALTVLCVIPNKRSSLAEVPVIEQ